METHVLSKHSQIISMKKTLIYSFIPEFECCNKFWCAFNRGFVMIVTMNGRVKKKFKFIILFINQQPNLT